MLIQTHSQEGKNKSKSNEKTKKTLSWIKQVKQAISSNKLHFQTHPKESALKIVDKLLEIEEVL